MRRIRNPENYSSPAQAAAFLRETADKIDQGKDYVSVQVNVWFARPHEIDVALRKKGLPGLFRGTETTGSVAGKLVTP